VIIILILMHIRSDAKKDPYVSYSQWHQHMNVYMVATMIVDCRLSAGMAFCVNHFAVLGKINSR
jgi:hypothetical protein